MHVPRALLRLSGKVQFSTRLSPQPAKAKVLKVKSLKQDSAQDRKIYFKKINFENKHLFGALLETKKERDQRISEENCTTDASGNTIVASESKTAKNERESGSKLRRPKASSSKKSSVKFLDEKSPDAGEKGKKKRKKKTEDKENNAPCVKETNSKNAESPAGVCPSPELLSPQMSDALRSGNEFPSEERQIDHGTLPFPLVNESKTELEIKPDSEVIVGRTITKSDGFYKYPSVTRILNLTMSEASKSALLRWRNGLIMEMGEEKFQEFHANLLHLGSLFHSNLQEYLQLAPRNSSVLDPELEGCWKSLDSVFKNVSEVKLLESHVVHEELKYRGIIDCIAMYRDSPLIIEWKKSNKPKSTLAMTYDAPLQLCAYIGALNYDSSYPFKVSKGLVVVAYSDGAPANVFPLSSSQLNLYWKAWMERYKKFTDMVHIETAEKEVKAAKKEAILPEVAAS